MLYYLHSVYYHSKYFALLCYDHFITLNTIVCIFYYNMIMHFVLP